jgi:hypothetical protein
MAKPQRKPPAPRPPPGARAWACWCHWAPWWRLLLVILLALGGVARWLLFSEDGARWALDRVPWVQATGFEGAPAGRSLAGREAGRAHPGRHHRVGHAGRPGRPGPALGVAPARTRLDRPAPAPARRAPAQRGHRPGRAAPAALARQPGLAAAPASGARPRAGAADRPDRSPTTCRPRTWSWTPGPAAGTACRPPAPPGTTCACRPKATSAPPRRCRWPCRPRCARCWAATRRPGPPCCAPAAMCRSCRSRHPARRAAARARSTRGGRHGAAAGAAALAAGRPEAADANLDLSALSSRAPATTPGRPGRTGQQRPARADDRHLSHWTTACPAAGTKAACPCSA